MLSTSSSKVLSTGLAMFSMFFGAGNVVFPLVVGQAAGDQTVFAMLGLLITAVGVPFLGLLAILLFQGNYQKFFARAGKVPGFVLAAAIMLLIGPFGGLPRCIALSYSTINVSWPVISFGAFSFLSCAVIFLCTCRKNRCLGSSVIFSLPCFSSVWPSSLSWAFGQAMQAPPHRCLQANLFGMGLWKAITR